MNYINYYLSPLGRITLASGGETLTGLWFEGQTTNIVCSTTFFPRNSLEVKNYQFLNTPVNG